MVHRVETTSTALRERLELLNIEFATASLMPISHDGVYMRDLRADLDETRTALVVASVTEIAMSRAIVSGPLLG